MLVTPLIPLTIKGSLSYNISADITLSEFLKQRAALAAKRDLDMYELRAANKIIVIGSPGAGKSTFARKLKEKTNLPLHYLDMLFHNPDRTTSDKETFDKNLYEIISSDSWIIDGNYIRTLPLRFQAAEQIFLLDLPLEDCLRGAESRVGKERDDMPWIEDEFDPDFRQYIIDFPNDQLPLIYSLINIYRETKDIIIFKSHQEADEYLEALNNKE